MIAFGDNVHRQCRSSRLDARRANGRRLRDAANAAIADSARSRRKQTKGAPLDKCPSDHGRTSNTPFHVIWNRVEWYEVIPASASAGLGIRPALVGYGCIRRAASPRRCRQRAATTARHFEVPTCAFGYGRLLPAQFAGNHRQQQETNRNSPGACRVAVAMPVVTAEAFLYVQRNGVERHASNLFFGTTSEEIVPSTSIERYCASRAFSIAQRCFRFP